jgi:hypothetical protein
MHYAAFNKKKDDGGYNKQGDDEKEWFFLETCMYDTYIKREREREAKDARIACSYNFYKIPFSTP